MPRIALGLEYDGSHFHGWQRQPGCQTVQARLEQALSKVANHSENAPVEVYCAGRTDTGVHALKQIVHFDTTTEREMKNWVFGTNHSLSRHITVLWAKQVTEDFHARFSARARRYQYVIFNHRLRPALMRQYVTWHYQPLDISLMQQAANLLVGEHDFTSFRAMSCQSQTPYRNVHFINVKRQGDYVLIDIQANAFLHHMVRNIAGVLIAIGNGKKLPAWAQEVLLAKNRSAGGITAPPYGLYFADVDYPSEFALPQTRGSRLLSDML
jgi:tRNA pseudouridine38-40 synthase